MQKHLRHLIRDVRNTIQERTSDTSKSVQDIEIIQSINEGQAILSAEIVEMYEDFFGDYTHYDLVSGQAIYELVQNLIKMRYLEYVYGGVRIPIPESKKLEGEESFVYSSYAQAAQNFAYALFGNDLHLDPTPTESQSQAVKMYFIRILPHLTMGISKKSETTNEIVFDQCEDEDANALDSASDIDDDYKGLYVHIFEGTGIGQKRKITAYDGSTKKCTLKSNWTPSLDNTSRWALSSPIPYQFHDLLHLYAAICKRGDKDELTPSLEKRYSLLHDAMMDVLEQRNTAIRSSTPWDQYDGMFDD